MMQKLSDKYREKEQKIMYYLKSKYSSEKIEKLHKVLRYVCCFLLFVNVCTTMLQINVLANNIEEKIVEKTETLTVILSNQDGNVWNDHSQSVENEENTQVQTTKTYSLDSFSKELEIVVASEDLEEHQENLYLTKRLIVLSDQSEFNNYGASSVISYDNLYILSYDSEELCKKAHEFLINNNDIISVEVDSVMEIEETTIQNTTETEVQTDSELKKHLDSLDVKSEVNVAILDTGVDISNHLLKDRLIDLKVNLSSSGEEDSIVDDNGHGTDMATLIAENSNNHVKLMPIKIANKSGKATILSTYIGMKKAMENDANIINISMNTAVSSSSQILTNIINEAADKGIIVVVSAGNDGLDVKNFTPSNIDSAIVVSAVENDNTFSQYSNYGETIDYCSNGSYHDKNGTSYAAANVAGIIGDLLSKNESVSILNNYAIDLGDEGFDHYFGNGLIALKVNTKIRDDWTYVDENKDNIVNMPDFNTLTDEEINKYVDNSEPWQIGYYLNKLSEEDYSKMIKRNTSISKEITLYDLVEDSEDEYKVLTTNKRDCYYYEFCSQQYLEYKETLQTNAPDYNRTTGWYELRIKGTKQGIDERTGMVRINVQFNNKTNEPKKLTSSTSGGSNHIWITKSGTTRDFSILEASTKNAPNMEKDYYGMIYVKCTIDVPAYSYMRSAGKDLENDDYEDHGRLNFDIYNQSASEGKDGSSLLDQEHITGANGRSDYTFYMQAHIHQMGIKYAHEEDDVAIHNTITLEMVGKTHNVELKAGTGIQSVSGGFTEGEATWGTYYYGQEVTIDATVKTNTAKYSYAWSRWEGEYGSTSKSYTFIMPNQKVSLTAKGTQTLREYTQTVKYYTWNAASSSWRHLEDYLFTRDYGTTFTPAYVRDQNTQVPRPVRIS